MPEIIRGPVSTDQSPARKVTLQERIADLIAERISERIAKQVIDVLVDPTGAHPPAHR